MKKWNWPFKIFNASSIDEKKHIHTIRNKIKYDNKF